MGKVRRNTMPLSLLDPVDYSGDGEWNWRRWMTGEWGRLYCRYVVNRRFLGFFLVGLKRSTQTREFLSFFAHAVLIFPRVLPCALCCLLAYSCVGRRESGVTVGLFDTWTPGHDIYPHSWPSRYRDLPKQHCRRHGSTPTFFPNVQQSAPQNQKDRQNQDPCRRASWEHNHCELAQQPNCQNYSAQRDACRQYSHGQLRRRRPAQCRHPCTVQQQQRPVFCTTRTLHTHTGCDGRICGPVTQQRCPQQQQWQ